MAWSKVRKDNAPYPMKWWYHKILCEFGYWREKKFRSVQGMGQYYYHLQKMCQLGYNLYGDKVNN